ncbi:hypothetical protein [Pseudooceanicola sp.]|uniref:hypothetical protein n=1 Tax=Pseudooceanicola sp. TaxID=1914328 RepID=UPI002622D4ED|nr:hypothetical protein [Pseudooceanicola sp.]MDF1855092.1 hypothetical protein [Pseudooceanicola sp.]
MSSPDKTSKRNQYRSDFLAVERAYSARNPETNCTYSTPRQALIIANFVLRWKETGQHSFLDVAIQYCDDHDLPILRVLRKYLAESARLRSPLQETKAWKEGHKNSAFRLMTQLIHSGASLSEAAGKAAAWLNDMGVEYMASTLEKQYTEAMRSGG